jgi:hypothetical protein
MLATPVMAITQKGTNLFDNVVAPDGLRRLAQGVVIQATRDAKKGNHEAVQWLIDIETSDTWLALADVDRRAVLDFLQCGCKWAKGRWSRKH